MYAMRQFIGGHETIVTANSKGELVCQLITLNVCRDKDTNRVYEGTNDKAIAFFSLEYNDDELSKELTQLGIKILKNKGWQFYKLVPL